MRNGFHLVVVVSIILVLAGYGVLRWGRDFGPLILAMTLVPIGGVLVAGVELKRLIPDFIFGMIDTGLLTLAVVIGAWSGFGVVGAIVGGVVGDSITDGIAGFFEGGIADWLRKRGIDESRTAVGSACGKIAGCLFGAGVMLTLLWLTGIRVEGAPPS